jgi:hypothetical protein
MFYDALLKGGIPMLIGTIALLGLILAAGIQILLHSQRHWFGLALVSSSLALLAFGLADDPIWGNDIATLIWILIGAGFGVVANLKQPHPKP